MEKLEPLCSAGCNVKWNSCVENGMVVPQKIKNGTIMWPSNSLLGIYLKWDICIPMFKVALFSRVTSWKEPKWSSVDEWINETYYPHTMEYCLVDQLYLTLCYPLACSPPGYSVHGIFLGKNTGVGCYNFLLQGIFLTQRLNPHLLISYISGRFFTCWTIKYYSALKRMEILTYVTFGWILKTLC